MENALFVMKAIAPFALLLSLGVFLAWRRLTDAHFASVANTIVFWVALPALIITEFLKPPFTQVLDTRTVGIAVGVTIGAALLGWPLSKPFCRDPLSRGPFAQGIFRSNIALISLPLVQRALPVENMPFTLALMAILIPLYNV